MASTTAFTRVVASGFVLAGGAGICAWIWPDDNSIIVSSVAVVSALVSVLVVASLWKK